LAFAGTPDFAVPSLHAALAAGHEIASVLTQPDRPAGRGRRLTPPPIKRAAQEAGLPVQQPCNLDEAALREAAGGAGLDALIVVAFGQILPRDVLAAPRLGAINVHASLLPRWRGPAPIARALLAGDDETGVTIMRMQPGVDTGPVLLRRRCPIAADDTAARLHDRLARLGGDALAAVLADLAGHLAGAEAQSPAQACHAPKLTRAEGAIDWTAPAAEIAWRVRALQPWPGAWTTLAGETLRVWGAECVSAAADAAAPPATVIAAGRAGIDVAAGQDALRITRLQPAGRRAMDAGDFVNARNVLGCRLGT
jgi:methionyl-tRNA formyltransferase